MQTVYLLAGDKDSSNALYKLRRSPDMTTLIIVVPKSQKKLIFLDKRVKSFPFIINTPPTRQGLIPKRAIVMSFGKAVKVSQGFRSRFFTKPKKPVNRYGGRTVNIPPVNFTSVRRSAPVYRPPLAYKPPRVYKPPPAYKLPTIGQPANKKMNFSITKVENCDGATLILKKN